MMVKYDNTHETFFVYSYQQIFDMINNATDEVCMKAGMESGPIFRYSESSQLLSLLFTKWFTGYKISPQGYRVSVTAME